VFKSLRLMRDQGKSFDLIGARSAQVRPTAHHGRQMRRAPTSNSTCVALKLLRPGGLLATFFLLGTGVMPTCSQKISRELR